MPLADDDTRTEVEFRTIRRWCVRYSGTLLDEQVLTSDSDCTKLGPRTKDPALTQDDDCKALYFHRTALGPRTKGYPLTRDHNCVTLFFHYTRLGPRTKGAALT